MRSYDLTDGMDPMSHAEIDYLKELARTLPDNAVIVNIGAADGVSTCAFLEERPRALIYSVDVDPCPQELENARRCGLDAGRIVRLLGRSEQIGLDFPHTCDLLFVDGGHFNAGNDTDAWLHAVKPGGLVAYHDCMVNPPSNNPSGVYGDVAARFDLDAALNWVDRLIAFRV